MGIRRLARLRLRIPELGRFAKDLGIGTIGSEAEHSCGSRPSEQSRDERVLRIPVCPDLAVLFQNQAPRSPENSGPTETRM